MISLQTVFRSVLADGFEGHREPLEVAFAEDASMGIPNFSVRLVDGMQRSLCCLALAHYIVRLDRAFPAVCAALVPPQSTCATRRGHVDKRVA
jgi:hypothetical protein